MIHSFVIQSASYRTMAFEIPETSVVRCPVGRGENVISFGGSYSTIVSVENSPINAAHSAQAEKLAGHSAVVYHVLGSKWYVTIPGRVKGYTCSPHKCYC